MAWIPIKVSTYKESGVIKSDGRAGKEPYPPGTMVALVKDKNINRWRVITRLQWGTYLIQRVGVARPTRFSNMYVTESQIRRI